MKNQLAHRPIRQNNSSKAGWTKDEKLAIADAVFPLLATQKYKQSDDAKLLMKGWERKLAGRYSIEQIIFALEHYTDYNDDFPAPANLISILEPEETQISKSEYIEALRWQKQNAFPAFSDAKTLINSYEAQERKNKDTVKKFNNHIAALPNNQLPPPEAKKIT